MDNWLLSFIAVFVLALSHVVAAWLPRTSHAKGHGWISAAGGAAVAYVFVYILPKLAKQSQALVAEHGPGLLGLLDRHVYVVAMLGLMVYYGVNRLVDVQTVFAGGQTRFARVAIGAHVGSFAAYSLLVGFLIAELGTIRIEKIVLVILALALHFFSNGHYLRECYGDVFRRFICWILAAAVLVGWLIGLAMDVTSTTVALSFAFLAGAVIINTIREELPHERLGNYWAFFGGAVGYATLVLTAAYLFKG